MRIRIAEVRAAAGLTQAELAEKIGISRAYLAQIESGVRKLTTENQSNIALGLGVAPTELVDFDAPDKAEEGLLVEAFRSMNKEQRAAWLDIARITLGKREL
ncbi:helix-turn-helix transcriptional regulator [Thalassovita sp.]|uniref:helix-turn-helix domain-containing protein n=1 Tax=Thalassovita sp. TaxID=1979401 RepID=UPI002B270B5C|nr:helix-turn-helix transcriptional regulator [Thalassovita sp.]